MERDLVAEFMNETKERDANSIKGKNVLIVNSNKIYRNVKGVFFFKDGTGFVQFTCDGVRYKTNAEIIIREGV